MMKEKKIQKGRSKMLLKRLPVSVLSLVFLLSSVYLNSMTVHAAVNWVSYDFSGYTIWYDYDSYSNITFDTREITCNKGDGGYFQLNLSYVPISVDECAHLKWTAPTTPIEGTVSIDGTTEVGQTLSVNYTGGNSSDVGTNITYQWYRDTTEIPGATSNTYTLVEDDKGHKIKVKITGTGSYSGDLESAQTSTVTAAPTPTPPSEDSESGSTDSGDSSSGSSSSDSPSSDITPATTTTETKPVDTMPEREVVESTMPISPVTIDTTQFKQSDSNVIPGTAYNLSNFITTSGIVRGINAAVASANKTGSTEATIYSGKPICFNSAILKAISDGNKDIVYYFIYKGHVYSVTVPATVEAKNILDKAPFAGPLYVGQQLGTTKLLK